MSMNIRRDFCVACDKPMRFEGNRPSHLLHLVLTMFTFCLWAIVWIMVSASTTYTCVGCGWQAPTRFFGMATHRAKRVET